MKTTKDNYVKEESWENTPVAKLVGYYKRQLKLLEGYEKDPSKLKLHKEIINQWLDTIIMYKELYDQVGLNINGIRNRGDRDR